MPSKPEWDGVEQRFITWQGKILPCVSVLGRTTSTFEGEPYYDPNWTASLPMENRCVLDLHVPPDEDESCWVCISAEAPPDWPNDLEWPFFHANIEHEKIVLREEGQGDTEEDRYWDAISAPWWLCDVEGPDEVLDYLKRWGQLPVVRG